jgi:hypothetical protein
MLYARYSADGKHWTTWQLLPEFGPGGGRVQEFRGKLRVPYRERARYEELRLAFARREDTAWASDEEALAREIVKGKPGFFGKAVPFIGHVQLLYEARLPAGVRLQKIDLEVAWQVSGKHLPPKEAKTAVGRDVPWRFIAP